MYIYACIMDIHDWIIDTHVIIIDILYINNWFMDSLDERMDTD